MSAVELFRYQDRDVRTVLIDDEPRLVVVDICNVLGLRDPSSALKMVDDDDVLRLRRSDTPQFFGGIAPQVQEIAVVNESGVYALVFQSRKPEAKAFRRWVTHEVLPAIRRTGTYGAAPALPDIATPEGVLVMAEQFAATARQLVAARAQVAELAPAANSWNTLATAQGDFLVADAAKILTRDPAIKLGRDRLFTLLRDLRWIYRQVGDGRWRVRQTAIETGRLTEIPVSHYHPRTGELVLDPPQVRVTIKGLGWLHQHLGGTAPLALDTAQVTR